MSADPSRVRRGRLILAGLFALFFLPVIAAIVAFVVKPGWTPFGTMNRGELISPPRELALQGASLIGDSANLMSVLSGRWVLLHTAPALCADACDSALLAMRQTRIALGKDADRVLRLWLVSGEPNERASGDVTNRYPGLVAAQADARIVSQLPRPAPDAIYVLDPTGLLILRYDGVDAAQAMLKDLKRLLKISKQD